MTSLAYQAKAGDGFKKKMLKRSESLFNTPHEVVSEVLALKGKMDLIYKNKIKWDYEGEVTGTSEKLNILKGYLEGDRRTKPFYLQILSVQSAEENETTSPIEGKKLSVKDKRVFNKIVKLLKKNLDE